MSISMMTNTQPFNLQGLTVVRVVTVTARIAAHATRQPLNFTALYCMVKLPPSLRFIRMLDFLTLVSFPRHRGSIITLAPFLAACRIAISTCVVDGKAESSLILAFLHQVISSATATLWRLKSGKQFHKLHRTTKGLPNSTEFPLTFLPEIECGQQCRDDHKGEQKTMQSVFTIGQKVKAISFTDCFGKLVPETPDLTVTEIRRIESEHGTPTYFRIKADHADGFQYIEGAERYFAAY